MTVFCDSSALVKLYADEPGHEVIRKIAAPTVVSALCRVEVPSALWRKHRAGQLSAQSARLLVEEFECDYGGVGDGTPRFLTVAVVSSLLEDAAELVAVHGLRAYDAVQLASAIAVRAQSADCGTFACFDATLNAAAASRGFALVDNH